MDYSSQEEPHHSRPSRHHHDHKASPTDLLSDAQLLAGAAFNRKAADKAKLAGAAENLLAAASDYGKLDQGSYGTYIEKAEGFLHKYHSGGSEHASSNPTKTQHSASRPKTEEEEEYYEEAAPRPLRKKKEEDYEEDYEEAAPRPSRKKKDEDEEESGGGFGDYMKIAQGFLKK